MEFKPAFDRCHICGRLDNLSFEHVPPKKAFNNTGVLIADMNFERPFTISGVPQGATTFQRGMGSYSLCCKCNNDTGSWYGQSFIQFCRKGMNVLQKTNYKPTLFYFGDIYPLAVIKQIICMFFTVNSLAFRDKYTDLVRFVLDRYVRHLHPRYHVYIYYNHGGMHRTTPLSAKLDFKTSTMEHVRTSLMTEISYPPFGYLMTIDSEPPDTGVVDITFFASCEFNQLRTLSMRCPVCPTHTIFPGDYRSADRIVEDIRTKGGVVP